MARTPTLHDNNPRPQRVTHLPRSATSESHRVGKGVAAAAGAVALLIGVPLLLILLIGNPLPTTAPSRDWLTADVSARLVINVLAVLVWIVWAHFVVCFLTEWRALRAGRMPDRVLMGGGSQQLARQLIAGLLLLTGGATIATGLTSAAMAQSAQPSQSGSSVSASVTPQAQASVNGSTGQVQATADQDHSSARQLKLGTVHVPDGRHHDTLWGIAERTLGDPTRWKEVFELNKGRIQPDGRKLVDADLIRPGWQLVLPADAHGRDVRLLGGSLPPVAPVGGGAQTSSAAGTSSLLADQSASPAQQAGQESTDSNASTALLLGGGLVLAGVLTALSAKRGPYGNPDDAEDALRLAANTGRANFLDEALRVLADSRVGQGLPMPDVSVVYLNDDQVIVHLAGASEAPAHPWTAAEDQKSWSVKASDLEGYSTSAPAPYPALVNIAASHGFDVLVDLEYASGLVAVGGDSGVAREVVMSSVVDLATHPWSDSVEVTMVGFGDDITEISPDQLHTEASLDAAIDAIERKLGATSDLLRRLGVDGVLSGRGKARDPELRPHVLVTSGSPTAAQVQRIRALSSGGRTAFAALTVGDAPGARWRFAAESGGSIDLGVLGVTGAARRYTLAAHQELRTLMSKLAADSAEQARVVAETGPRRMAAQLAGARPGAASAPVVGDPGATVAVRLLGAVAVKAPGPVEDTHRALLTELVVMAALHPQGLHETVISSGLWPRGVSEDVVARTLKQAQTWLGSDASGAHRLRRAEDGLWSLTGDVYVDWNTVQALAVTAEGPDDSETAAMVRALGLAAGEVFSGTPTGRYTWLSFHRAARDARALISTMASRAAALLVGAGDRAGAEQALRNGLTMVPAAEMLWRDLVRLRSEQGPEAAGEVAAELRRALPGQHLEPETEALLADLAPGSQQKASS